MLFQYLLLSLFLMTQGDLLAQYDHMVPFNVPPTNPSLFIGECQDNNLTSIPFDFNDSPTGNQYHFYGNLEYWFILRWTGIIQTNKTGWFNFTCGSDDGFKLFINETLVSSFWEYRAFTNSTGSFYLLAGTNYTFEIQYFQGPAAKRFTIYATPTGCIFPGGLYAEYWNYQPLIDQNPNPPTNTTIDPQIHLSGNNIYRNKELKVTWSGKIFPPHLNGLQNYTFTMNYYGGSMITIHDTVIFTNLNTVSQSLISGSTSYVFMAGTWYNIIVIVCTYYPIAANDYISLSWSYGNFSGLVPEEAFSVGFQPDPVSYPTPNPIPNPAPYPTPYPIPYPTPYPIPYPTPNPSPYPTSSDADNVSINIPCQNNYTSIFTCINGKWITTNNVISNNTTLKDDNFDLAGVSIKNMLSLINSTVEVSKNLTLETNSSLILEGVNLSIKGNLNVPSQSSIIINMASQPSHINISGCAYLAGHLEVVTVSDQENKELNLINSPCLNGSFSDITVTLMDGNKCNVTQPISNYGKSEITIIFTIINQCTFTESWVWVIVGVFAVLLCFSILFGVSWWIWNKKKNEKIMMNLKSIMTTN